MRFKFFYILILTFVLCLVDSNRSVSANDYLNAFRAKFLYMITKQIEWPSSRTSGDFVVGILADQTVVDALNTAFTGKTVGAQSVKVEAYSTIKDMKFCHLLYVAPDKSTELSSAISIAKKNNTLLIAEKDGLIKQSCLNLLPSGPKFELEINKGNFNSFGLKYAATLEKYAKNVVE